MDLYKIFKKSWNESGDKAVSSLAWPVNVYLDIGTRTYGSGRQRPRAPPPKLGTFG